LLTGYKKAGRMPSGSRRMKRLIALVVVLALALAQGLEAFWKAVEVPGGVCSDGSPYRLYVSPGDPKKVVLDFQGGGACWDAATCASWTG
jgi:hypothetical protein